MTAIRVTPRSGLFVILALLILLSGCAAQIAHREGMAALSKGRLVDGVAKLHEAAQLEPHDATYQRDWLTNRDSTIARLLAEGDAAAAQGKVSAAGERYRTALQIDPAHVRARQRLADLDDAAQAQADLERAQAAWRRAEQAEASAWLNRALDRVPDLPAGLKLKREMDGQRPLPDLTVSLAGMYRKPVSLEFRDTSLKMIFDALSRTTGINFILDRDVKAEQRTSVALKQTPFEDAVDVILSTNQLEKKLLNPTSILIYPNTAAKIKEHQDLLVRAFYLSNVDAKTAASMLKSVLKLKDVYVDEKYHMLVLRENPETLQLAERLIALQDLDDPEVMLDVEVLEVNRNRLLNLGVQLTNQFTISPLGANNDDSTTGGATGAARYRLSDLLHLNSDKLGITPPSATINLQKTDGEANLLANPRLRVRDRDKARILIGDKVPVVTTTATPNGFLSENVQYLDVGLKLEVEPEIHLRDEIGLKLSLEVSSVVGAIKTTTGSQAFQIGTRNISTSLRLRDGETQVLAGLINDTDRTDANRIPLLGDIPLLGRLFSSQKDDHQKTEIVMAITPHLIRNIQRKGPAAETFWSGTEANLRTRAMQLGTVAVAPAPPAGALPPGSPSAPPDTSGVKLSWVGPKRVKAGQSFALRLQADSQHDLRALPLQVGINPKDFEIVSVQPGDYFSRGAPGQFSQTYDRASGQLAVSLVAADGKGRAGAGSLLTLELRPVTGAASAEVVVAGATPVGSRQAVSRPALPVVWKAVVTP